MACNKVLEIDNCKWEAKEIKKNLAIYIYILVTLSILLPFLFFYFNIFFLFQRPLVYMTQRYDLNNCSHNSYDLTSDGNVFMNIKLIIN
jgi:hypothetical protein